MTSKLFKKIRTTLGPAFFKMADLNEDLVWLRSSDFRQSLYVNTPVAFGFQTETLLHNPDAWIQQIQIDERDKVRQKTMEWLSGDIRKQALKLNYHVINLKTGAVPVQEVMLPIFEGDECIAFLSTIRHAPAKNSVTSAEGPGYFFRFFAEKSRSIFWVRDKTGTKFLYLSPACELVWGRSQKMILDNPSLWDEALVEEDRAENSLPLVLKNKKSLHDDATYQSENRYRIRHANGEIRWIKDTNFPIRNEAGELLGYAGIADDITEDALREQELRDAKERAENANRAKSDFLAMMSHELRAPLNAILGMAQILRPSSLDEAQRDQVEVIETSGHNLLSLLNDILDFAKLEMGKLSFRNENVDLLSLLRKIQLDLSQAAKEKRLDLRLEIDEELPRYIKGDPKRIRQILTNLVSNAIKYTQIGHVVLQAIYEERDNQNGNFIFVVKDSGIGIPRNKLDTVFQRFQQIDSVYSRKHEGVGLGLAIVKELIERMGGSISVSSEMGLGSTFTCILPLQLQIRVADYLAEPAAEYKTSAQLFQQFDARVLVVEDNLINQKVASALLQQLGCVVDIVDNGEAALRKFQDGYDLIFLDIGLPDMDGFAVGAKMRELEEEGEHIPIVALTAHVFAQDRKRCFDVGMDEVMAKPVMREDLIAVLRRWTRVQV